MNYLKTGTQIQKERHRNHLHREAFPMIQLKKLLSWEIAL